MRGLEGRTSLAPGAGGGIGPALSARPAARGAQVVVRDVDAETAHQAAVEMTAAGHRAAARAVDLLDPAACAAAVEEVVAGRPQEVAALMAFLDSDEAPSPCGSIAESTGAQAVA